MRIGVAFWTMPSIFFGLCLSQFGLAHFLCHILARASHSSTPSETILAKVLAAEPEEVPGGCMLSRLQDLGMELLPSPLPCTSEVLMQVYAMPPKLRCIYLVEPISSTKTSFTIANG